MGQRLAGLVCLISLLGCAFAQNFTGAPQTWTCRMAEEATHGSCGLPYELANFQGFFQCDDSTKVGRPADIDELKQLVQSYEHIKAVGVGHSWNKEQFCANTSADSSLNLVMTELLTTVNFIENPSDPTEWGANGPPPNFPIQASQGVDEDAARVTVAAGVPQRMLLDYLSKYTAYKQPAGWTLPAFSWFIDQTIGGAVATGTHGSSMTWGSLSSQTHALKLVVANGTEVTLTRESHPHLWRAAGVSVGRLGVITELTLAIVPQQAVTRSLETTQFANFTAQMLEVQEDYVAARESGDEDAIKAALFAVDETQLFWFLPNRVIWRTDYSYSDKEPSDVIPNIDPADAATPEVSAQSGPSDDIVFDQAYTDPVRPNAAIRYGTDGWTRFYTIATQNYVRPGTFERRKAFLSQTEFTTASASFAPYDQYEVSIPLERAGTCLQEVGAEIYGPAKLYEGFRTPGLIRFVNGEEFYLSPTHGGPRMYINIEDYISRSTGKPNTQFQTVIQLFREKCGARLHWGKAGWPEHAQCFDGSVEYPNTWCDYGCAVAELDPGSKFQPLSSLWQWHAQVNGTEVRFDSCCTSQGFDARCTCAPRTSCEGVA
ncbi:hypothetical protein APUTEX25_003070 [Auxenochlorella protothecoides]|uniref:FAD-binding PCMH-type domain-containing protein n=1 Tax=Auxenochlorella protothecoides TaxID=3075 RepID=A0A3M7KZG7_AUXPR|nr:hypothetical protein APUTEX25_003070 [Auxenochlorella protothecoides]|eukprot:RMZ54692.1 hypothetical protein APUTEX25_003070 [Auxenochlorella protothecoides]